MGCESIWDDDEGRSEGGVVEEEGDGVRQASETLSTHVICQQTRISWNAKLTIIQAILPFGRVNWSKLQQ